MAAPYTDLASKMEAAIKAVVDALTLLDAASAAVPCLTGLDDDPNQTPCVTVRAKVGGESIAFTGNDEILVTVRVYTRVGGDKGESLANHRTRVATVFDALRNDELHITLNAVSGINDFTVFEMWKASEDELTTATSLVSELNLEGVACATDLTLT